MLGADSARTDGGPQGAQQYNHNQKLFEIGRDSNYGLVTWGNAGLNHVSYRTLIARLADALPDLHSTPVADVVAEWVTVFFPEYQQQFANVNDQTAIAQCSALVAQQQAAATPLTEPERTLLAQLLASMNAAGAGFCIGGVSNTDHQPEAYTLWFSPLDTTAPTPTQLACPSNQFWGAPNFLARLLTGADLGLKKALLDSGNWTGTEADFDTVLQQFDLGVRPQLPLRDGIDWVFTAIYTNVKAYKFAHRPRICGGPVEIAVVSSDRPFRWVMHKRLDRAIWDGLEWGEHYDHL